MKSISCLDKGFVRLVDSMGDDRSIVQAARVSYGSGLKGDEADKKLLKYLYTHRHTSPFEQVEFKFHCRMPIFVARQWVRYRTASLNEISARYTELSNDYYVPSDWRKQDDKNKQGSSASILQDTNHMVCDALYFESCKKAVENYQKMLARGVAREMARMVLPVSMYTEWYWKQDLHNLLHFLRQRLDHHAQYEIRVYAEAIRDLITPIVPWTMELFNGKNN